jgi:hypothetical protein
MPEPINVSEGFSKDTSERNILNAKVGYDRFSNLMATCAEQFAADTHALRHITIRSAQNAASFDKLLDGVSAMTFLNSVTAAQVGDTEAQQTVSPEDTATSEAIKGGVGVSAESVAASLAGLVQALVPVIVATSGTVSTQTVASLLATVVAAAGKSSAAAAA